MRWNDEALDRIAAGIPCGYHRSSPPSCEPTALAAIALSAAGRSSDVAIRWLASVQVSDGILSASDQPHDNWPTGWAVLAALASSDPSKQKLSWSSPFDVSRAVRWILQTSGDSAASGEGNVQTSAPAGWPWVTGTYSWVEPTAIQVLALKAAGYGSHPRTREAVAMLTDRLLRSGGCNYGNTVVLGQELRPHLQPTGLAMMALVGEANGDIRIERSLNYLATSLSAETASASLAYGLMGLAAHNRLPADAPKWLAAAYRRTISRDANGYKLALLSLASFGAQCPLIKLLQNPQSTT
jgi:hypothetical protein